MKVNSPSVFYVPALKPCVNYKTVQLQSHLDVVVLLCISIMHDILCNMHNERPHFAVYMSCYG